jgi:hypothetical protein
MSARPFDERTDVDITGLDWWRVLQRLHQHTKAIGLGHLRDRALTDREAQELIGEARLRNARKPGPLWFDYVGGRPVKVGFVEEGERSWITRADLYDRDSVASAQSIVDALRREAEPPS